MIRALAQMIRRSLTAFGIPNFYKPELAEVWRNEGSPSPKTIFWFPDKYAYEQYIKDRLSNFFQL
jgi:hypothetical protein